MGVVDRLEPVEVEHRDHALPVDVGEELVEAAPVRQAGQVVGVRPVRPAGHGAPQLVAVHQRARRVEVDRVELVDLLVERVRRRVRGQDRGRVVALRHEREGPEVLGLHDPERLVADLAGLQHLQGLQAPRLRDEPRGLRERAQVHRLDR
ncbi:hypothetical protein K3N28_23095 [Glycomyces sp. TRM65418]|uniref:hypothetical protein n=1 Tax=Glycomyces sp. TRM65418 TaxID=2867006 RepID=UPI001D164B8F|nr:hypothetical protein [Glycomyces sp. TRM65418]MCC3765951.1 hypothetical protein [Glycomyces sp. TRM65418]